MSGQKLDDTACKALACIACRLCPVVVRALVDYYGLAYYIQNLESVSKKAHT